MATDDDTLTRPRSRPTSTLLPLPARAEAKPREPEAEPDGEAESGPWDDYDPLPLPGSPYTAAYARPGNKTETTLHVMLKDGSVKGYAWCNYDSVDFSPGDGPGNGPTVTLRFAGLVPTELRFTGKGLGKLHSCIGRQRIAWVREQPSKRGFGLVGQSEPSEVVAHIAVRQWRPERQSGGSE